MTPSTLFADAEAVFLDFDGPVCSVFATVCPKTASAAAASAVQRLGIPVQQNWYDCSDPHELLRIMRAHLPIEAVQAADAAVTEVEMAAVTTAAPSDGIEAVLDAIHPRPWAVVSNNSKNSIEKFFAIRSSMPPPDVICARPPAQPEFMKPHPYLLREACNAVQVSPASGIFIGDSVSDITAGRAAGVPTIGYANKHGKAQRLAGAGATGIVASLRELAPGVDARGRLNL